MTNTQQQAKKNDSFNQNKVSSQYENWIIFFLNYLSPYLSENDFTLFQQRWRSYWKLFQLWKAKKLENEAIKDTVKQLISTKKSLSSLIRKYQKKEIVDDSSFNSELEKIWSANDKNADLAQKYLAKPQKIHNFLCGQTKKQFPKLDIKKISEIISKFAETKIRQKNI